MREKMPSDQTRKLSKRTILISVLCYMHTKINTRDACERAHMTSKSLGLVGCVPRVPMMPVRVVFVNTPRATTQIISSTAWYARVTRARITPWATIAVQYWHAGKLVNEHVHPCENCRHTHTHTVRPCETDTKPICTYILIWNGCFYFIVSQIQY